MKFQYFPGCTLKTKGVRLDACARTAAKALGFTLEELPEWQCCGAVYPQATDEIATDVGTVVYGREAVACGLMDRLGSLRDALDCLHRQIARSKKPPEQKRK